MSIEFVDVNNINFDFCSDLLGYHGNKKLWKTFVGLELVLITVLQ